MDIQKDKQMDRLINGCTDTIRQMEGCTYVGQTEEQTVRQTSGQTDGLTDGQIDG